MQDPGRFFDVPLLEEIRSRFACVGSDPHSGRRIYFENAGGSLTLKSVVEAVAEHTALPDNTGRDNPASQAMTDVIRRGKENLQLFLGARSGVVFLGESTTSLAFRIIEPIVRSVLGTNVVTTNLDHPAIYDSTRWAAEGCGKDWRVAALDPTTGRVETEEILRHVDSDTSLLAFIHSSNNLGTRNDVERTIREVRKAYPDVYILVDGSQHVGHYPVDVDALGCDAYVFSTYKAFSKIGASFAYLSDRVAQLPHGRLRGSAKTHWEWGTQEPAGYAAWSCVTEYLCWLGSHFTSSQEKREKIVAAMKAIETHERALTHRLFHGTDRQAGVLAMKRVGLYGSTDPQVVREPVLALDVQGVSAKQVISHLADRGIRVALRLADYYSGHTLQPFGIEECVRVSLAHYNTPGEVDVFLEAMREVSQCATD